MEPKTRLKYVDYIAAVIRNATEECGAEWPIDTVLVVRSYSELAELDHIVGVPIYICNVAMASEFFFTFPAGFESARCLLKAAREYMDIYDIELGE